MIILDILDNWYALTNRRFLDMFAFTSIFASSKQKNISGKHDDVFVNYSHRIHPFLHPYQLPLYN